MLWRRSYDTPPPPLGRRRRVLPERRPALRGHAASELRPRTECLKDVVGRMLPYWYDGIVPDLLAGRTVLVAAHGNSLRALVKHLDGISDADIAGLNIPTGIPLRVRAGRATSGRSLRAARYLDPEAASGRDRGGQEPGQEEVAELIRLPPVASSPLGPSGSGSPPRQHTAPHPSSGWGAVMRCAVPGPGVRWSAAGTTARARATRLAPAGASGATAARGHQWQGDAGQLRITVGECLLTGGLRSGGVLHRYPPSTSRCRGDAISSARRWVRSTPVNCSGGGAHQERTTAHGSSRALDGYPPFTTARPAGRPAS